MIPDYEGGWYEEPEDESECPDVWHVTDDLLSPFCPTCGYEVGA